MELIVGIIIMGILLRLVFLNDSRTPRLHCVTHKWTVRNAGEENEYLACSECKFVPGVNGYEEG